MNVPYRRRANPRLLYALATFNAGLQRARDDYNRRNHCQHCGDLTPPMHIRLPVCDTCARGQRAQRDRNRT